MADLNNFYFTEKYDVSLQKLNEVHNIFDNKFVLDFIPDPEKRVKIASLGGQTAVEVNINTNITANYQYKVDYNSSGFVYFHPDLDGQTITVAEYYARGYVKINSSRVELTGDTSGDLNSIFTSLDERVTTNSTRIDNLVASAGDGNSEIVDARIAFDNTTYPNLGSHIRKIEEDLVTSTYGTITDALSNSIDLPDVYEGFAKDIVIKGDTKYDYKDNGVDYANWQYQNKIVNGSVEIVADGTWNSNSLSIANINPNTQYTIIFNIEYNDIDKNIELVQSVGFKSTGFGVLPNTSGVVKGLVTTNSEIANRRVSIVIPPTATLGRKIRVKLLAILEGDQTQDTTITKELDYGFNHVKDATISCVNSFKISDLFTSPILRGLPNGVRDSLEDGKKIQRVSDEVKTLSYDIKTSGINNSFYRLFLYSNMDNISSKTNQTVILVDNISKQKLTQIPSDPQTRDLIENRGKIFTNDNGVWLILEKDSVPIIDHTMLHELATPIETPLKQLPTLQVAPNTPVQIVAEDLTPYISLRYPQNQSAQIGSLSTKISELSTRTENLENKTSLSTYNNITEVGLLAGTETIESIVENMSGNAIGLFGINSLHNLSQYPESSEGTLKVNKNTISYTSIEFSNKDSNRKWVGIYHDANTPKFSGWKELATRDNVYNPNLLINGDFQVWQRGLNFTTNGYTSDRWKVEVALGATISVVKDTDGSLKYTQTGVYSSNIQQIIEGDYNLMKNNQVSVSVNLKTDANIVLALFSGGNLLQSLPITPNTNYSEYYFTTTIPNDITPNTLKLMVYFNSSQGYINLRYAKLELGDISTPFIPNSYNTELLACLRYYEKSYPDGFIEGDATEQGILTFTAITNEWLVSNFRFRQEKRIIPTVSIYNGSGNIGVSDSYTGVPIVTTKFNLSRVSESGVYAINTDPVLTTNYIYTGHFIADAEI